MQVVARVVRREEHFRVVGIAGRLVEVDGRIIRLAGPDPFVERLALRFADLGVIRRAVERRQGRPVDLQPSRVRLFD